MADASEYWGPLERLLSERTAVLHPETKIPDLLIGDGFVGEENRRTVADLLAEHQDGWAETEYDSYCKCGKWLEYGYYELEDHQAEVIKDAGLLSSEAQEVLGWLL